MLATDSIRLMPKPKAPRDENALTRRQALADIVEYFVGATEQLKTQIIASSPNVSESTFYRITRGVPVSNQKLWNLAKSLGIPTPTFTMVVAGDIEGIKGLVNLDSDSKSYIVSVLERSGQLEEEVANDS